MTQMGKNVPCLYEQMTAVPAAAGAQQQKGSEISLGYEEMLTGPTGAAVIVPAGGANGHFRPSPDKIEEVQTVDKMGYNSWKGMLARNIGRPVIVSFLVGSQNTVVAAGTLQEVGSDYITIYHPGRSAYITADLYSVRFVEFPQNGAAVTAHCRGHKQGTRKASLFALISVFCGRGSRCRLCCSGGVRICGGGRTSSCRR